MQAIQIDLDLIFLQLKIPNMEPISKLTELVIIQAATVMPTPFNKSGIYA